GSCPEPRRRPGIPSAARWPRPGISPARPGRSWSGWPARPSPRACTWPSPSAPPPCSAPPSWPRSSSVTCDLPPSPMPPSPMGESLMLLDHKTAIVYGAGGAIGSAVARAYAREGAEVHLAGRTAHVAQVDVLDRAAVARHADGVVGRGGIDICFNATSNDDVQGTPLLAMPFEEFLRPVTKAVTAHFNIAVAVGQHMTRRGRGVILVMAGGREAIPRLGGSHVAWAALAGLCRQLAAEFGPHGVRVSWPLS